MLGNITGITGGSSEFYGCDYEDNMDIVSKGLVRFIDARLNCGKQVLFSMRQVTQNIARPCIQKMIMTDGIGIMTNMLQMLKWGFERMTLLILTVHMQIR